MNKTLLRVEFVLSYRTYIMSINDKFNTLKNKDSFHGLSPVVATVLVVGVVVLLGGLVLFGVLGIFDDPNVSQAGLSFDTTGEDEITIQLISDVRADEVYFKDNDGVVTFFTEDDDEERYVLSEVGDSITIPSNRINGNQLIAIGVIDGEENVLYTQDLSELDTDTGTITGAISPENAQCNVAGGQTVRLINDDGIIVNETETDESGIFVFEGISQGDYTVNFCDNGGSGSGSGGGGGFFVGGAGHGGGGGPSGGAGAGGSLSGAGWVGDGSGLNSGDSVTVQNPDETSREFCGGEVRTEEGTGDISVELKDGDETIAEETDLDSGDTYCFEDIPIGQYEITADAPNHISQTNDVKVTSETTTVNNFFLKSTDSDFGTVNVGIITSDSNNSAEVTVQLVDTEENEVIAEETGGHLDGVYLSDDTITFDEERYRIEASATGYEDYETNTFEIRSDEVELATVFMVQQDTGTVTGVVEDETGSTVSDATIYETSLGQEVTTDSSGQFEVEVLPNEEVEVGAYKDGYTDASTTVTVGENEEESIILQTDQKFGSIEGYVATEDNFGEAGEGITIEVTNNDDEVVETTTVTQEDSSFTFDNLLAVDYTVTATDTQYEDSSETVSVEENETVEIGEIFLENIEFDVVVDNTGDGDADTIDEGLNMASNSDNILIVDTGTPYNGFVVDESSDLYIAGEEGQPTVDGDVTVNSNDNELRNLEITGTLSVNGDNNEFRDIDNNVIISGDNTEYINGNTDTITVEDTATDTLIRDVTVNSVTDNGASTVINNNTINAGLELGGSQTTVRENTIQDTQNPVTFTGVGDVEFVENTVTATNSSTALTLESPVGYSSLEATGNTFDGTVIIDGVQTTTEFNSNTFNGGSNAGLELTGTSTDISLVGETVTSTGSSAVIVQNATLTDSSVTLNSIRTTNTVSIENSTVSDPNFIVQEDNSVTDIGVEVINSNITSANIETNGGLPTGVRVEDSSFNTQSLDMSATNTGLMFRGNSDGTVNGEVSATGTDGIAVQYGAEDTTNTIDVTSTIIAQDSAIGHQINSSDVTLQGNKTLADNNTIGVQLNDDATITDDEIVYSGNDVGVEVTTTTDILGVDQTSIRTVDNDVGVRITDTADTNIVNMVSENDTTGVEVIGNTTITDSLFTEETTTAVSILGEANQTIENNQIYSDTYITSEQSQTVGANWYDINRADGEDAFQQEVIQSDMGENVNVDLWCMDADCEVTSDRPTGDIELTVVLQPDDTVPIEGTVGSSIAPDGQIDFTTTDDEPVMIKDIWTEDNLISVDIEGYESPLASVNITEDETVEETIIVEEIQPEITPIVELDTSEFESEVTQTGADITVEDTETGEVVHTQSDISSFQVESGTYDIYTEVDGFDTQMETVTVESQEETSVTFNHTPNGFGEVQATLIDGNVNEELEGETVRVRTNNDHWIISEETDENGEITANIPEDSAEYTVEGGAQIGANDYFATTSEPVSITEGTTESVTLTLGSNELTGEIGVANAEENVYPDTVTLEIERETSDRKYTVVNEEISLDDDGYEIGYFLRNGDFTITVSTDEIYTTETETVTFDEEVDEINIGTLINQPQLEISGNTYDAEEETNIDAFVSIANENDELSVSTGEDGTYQATMLSEDTTHEITGVATQDGYTETQSSIEVEPASSIQLNFSLDYDDINFTSDTIPQTIEQGETVTYTPTVTNEAQTSRTIEIQLREEGQVYETRTVTVDPEDSQSVSFDYTAEDTQADDVVLEWYVDGEQRDGFVVDFVVADIIGGIDLPQNTDEGLITIEAVNTETNQTVTTETIETTQDFSLGVGEGEFIVSAEQEFDNDIDGTQLQYETEEVSVTVDAQDDQINVGNLDTEVGFIYDINITQETGELRIDEERDTTAVLSDGEDIIESNIIDSSEDADYFVSGLTNTPEDFEQLELEFNSPRHETAFKEVTSQSLPAEQNIDLTVTERQGFITDVNGPQDEITVGDTFNVDVTIEGYQTVSDDYDVLVGGEPVETHTIDTDEGVTQTETIPVVATSEMVGTPTLEVDTSGEVYELGGEGVFGEINVVEDEEDTTENNATANLEFIEGDVDDILVEVYETEQEETLIKSGSMFMDGMDEFTVEEGNAIVVYDAGSGELIDTVTFDGNLETVQASNGEITVDVTFEELITSTVDIGGEVTEDGTLSPEIEVGLFDANDEQIDTTESGIDSGVYIFEDKTLPTGDYTVRVVENGYSGEETFTVTEEDDGTTLQIDLEISEIE